MAQRKYLGELLIEAGHVSREQLEHSLKKSTAMVRRIGEILIAEGLVSEENVAIALSKQLGFPYYSLEAISKNNDAIATIPESKAKHYEVIPISIEENNLTTGMVDPLNVFTVDALTKFTGCKIIPAICTRADVQAAITAFYDR